MPRLDSRRRVGVPQETATPEGPYEADSASVTDMRVRDEQSRFVEFVSQLYEEAERSLELSSGQREMRIVIHLVANHMKGRMVTSSSLAAASGLTYGTALRTIEDMMRRGMIVRRSRTTTGRAQSLHPSGELLSRWHGFAFRGEALLKFVTTADSSARRPCVEPADSILPAPAVLETKLTLSRGLRVLVHADPTFMAMLHLKRQFEMILGVTIHSRAHSIDRLRSELIANSELPVSKYDIVAVDLPWFGEMALQKRLLPLDGLIARSGIELADIYSDALASSRWAGTQYGVPIMTSGEMLVYRTDLLASLGLEPPRTVERTAQVARELHNPAGGVAGIAWNGARGTPVGHSFIMIMSAFGQPVVNLRRTADGFDAEHVADENLRPMFLSLEARQTAEYLLELLEVSPPDVLRMTWYDRARAFGQGRAAMAYSHSLLAPVHESDKASPSYRKTGYLPHPTGGRARPIVPMGGYSLAIPSNIAPDRIDQVWRALEALTSASAAKLYLMNGSLASPRVSVSRDPQVAALSPWVGAVDGMAAQGYLRMWPRPPVPGIADLIAIAGEEIHDMLRREKTVQEALTRSQNRTDVHMRSLGFY
jgi:multiple sugar transport system substrate-binding protein